MDLKTLLGDLYKDGMTIEDVVSALEDKELIEKSVLSGYVTKDIADKYATEAANYKKQLKERQTADERKAEEDAEAQAAIMNELETLRMQTTIAGHKTRYLELQYSPDLAASTAEALANGDMDTVFKNQAAHIQAQLKSVKAEALKNMEIPPAGNGNDAAKAAEMTKLYDQAISNGNMADAAYYQRILQQEKKG